MSVELKKTNPSCLNIDLIDLNSCIGNSLSAINKTFVNLQSAEYQMVDFFKNIKTNLTTFQSISTKMLVTGLNIQTINDVYKSPYTTVKYLSSEWNKKEFSVYYPVLTDIILYYSNITTYNNLISTWFKTNFLSKNFAKNQIVNVFVSLTYINYFDFVFRGTYLENCTPTNHSNNTISCNGCGGDSRNGSCNITGRMCRNAYEYCNRNYTQDVDTYTCQGYVRQTYIYDTEHTPKFYSPGSTGRLSINYELNDLEDKFLTRIIKLKFKNNSDILNWELI
jgi:hypothetical protein